MYGCQGRGRHEWWTERETEDLSRHKQRKEDGGMETEEGKKDKETERRETKSHSTTEAMTVHHVRFTKCPLKKK